MTTYPYKVSIVALVYNLQDYLPRCLDALVAQTLQEIEILCVDDGSTDNAPQIIEEYAKKYLAYNDIANYKEAKVYAKHSKTLHFNDLSETELEELKKKRDEAMSTYPDLNERDYSWAKPEVKNPTFKAIVEKTDIDYYEPFYKLSCNYIHGGVKGTFFDIGQLYGLSEEASIIIAQSNVGFTDPAQLTMCALLDIISALLSLNIDTEQLFQLVFLKNKIPEIAESFHEVEKDIEDREKSFRQQIK